MKYFYGLIILFVVVALIMYKDFATIKFQGSGLTSSILNSLIPGNQLRERVHELQEENEALRSKILNAVVDPTNKSVKVYSTYPFNGRKDISIAGGENMGFKKGDAVTFGQKVLVGKINEVLGSLSVVSTIYDSDWVVAVRIGEKEIDGLLEGGLNPKIKFVKGNAEIKEGDMVISASPDLPYGLEIGRIKNIKKNTDTPFQEAEVRPVILLDELRDVSVHR